MLQGQYHAVNSILYLILRKGYLRCGKVLQLKGENELAMKIYERGLKKVKIGADNERAVSPQQ